MTPEQEEQVMVIYARLEELRAAQAAWNEKADQEQRERLEGGPQEHNYTWWLQQAMKCDKRLCAAWARVFARSRDDLTLLLDLLGEHVSQVQVFTNGHEPVNWPDYSTPQHEIQVLRGALHLMAKLVSELREVPQLLNVPSLAGISEQDLVDYYISRVRLKETPRIRIKERQQ